MNQPSKQKIHIYTDNPDFGGCENMLTVFSHSKTLNDNFNIFIHYRHSDQYKKRFEKRVSKQVLAYGVRKIYSGDCLRTIKNSFIRKLCYLLEATLLKYPLTIWNVLVLKKYFKRKSIDILHINNGGYPAAMSCNAAVIAAKLSDVEKIIYVVNNKAVGYRNPMRWLDWPIDMLVKKCCNRFITGSKFSSSVLKKVLKLHSEKVTVINNAVQLPSKCESNTNLRHLHEVDEQQLCVGIVAIHEERKGHIYCLKAYKEILKKGLVPPKLLIEGSGSRTELLKSYVIKHGLEKFITFVGQLESVHDFYIAIDFLVLPSIDFEDFPNVIIEAMGIGLPVIGTKVAGIPEQIIDGENGYLVEPGNSFELAEAIIKLTTNECLRKKMAQKSKLLYKENYIPDVAINKYIKLYSNI